MRCDLFGEQVIDQGGGADDDADDGDGEVVPEIREENANSAYHTEFNSGCKPAGRKLSRILTPAAIRLWKQGTENFR